MTGLWISLGFVGWTILVLAVGYLAGRFEADDYYADVIEQQQDTIDALTPSGVRRRG